MLRFAVNTPTHSTCFLSGATVPSHTGGGTQLSQCLDQMAKMLGKTGLSTFFWKDVWFINCVAEVTECCMVTICDRASYHHLTAKAKPHSLSAVVSRCFSGRSGTARQGRPQGSPVPAPSRVLTCLPLGRARPCGQLAELPLTTWQQCCLAGVYPTLPVTSVRLLCRSKAFRRSMWAAGGVRTHLGLPCPRFHQPIARKHAGCGAGSSR